MTAIVKFTPSHPYNNRKASRNKYNLYITINFFF